MKKSEPDVKAINSELARKIVRDWWVRDVPVRESVKNVSRGKITTTMLNQLANRIEQHLR